MFVLLFGILVPPFLAVLPFPLAGYYGSRRYIYWLLYVFTVYTILEVIVGVVSIFYFYTQPLYMSLRIIDICFNLYVMRKASNLTSFAKYLEAADKHFLLNNSAIKTIEKGILI
jgi:hypothetical protein